MKVQSNQGWFVFALVRALVCRLDRRQRVSYQDWLAWSSPLSASWVEGGAR